MEQRLRNRGVMNKEDRMNLLPEALILRILSFLPTKLVIATSVLSKEWRSRWKLVPNLEFDSEDYNSEDHTFSEIVCKSFLSHKAPVLESFHLKFGSDEVNPVDIGLWVGIAFARHLRHLVLDFFQRRNFHEDGLVDGKWNEPRYVPECLLSHLETFVWTRYDWGREEEKEIATYILRNARRLKKATFTTNPIESGELNKLKERRKMLKELDGVVRASNSCHLVFEFDSSYYESDSS